jgi:hypothetical protein
MSNVKDLLQNIVTKNASEDTYRKSVDNYIASKKAIFDELSAAVTLGNDYPISFTPSLRSYLAISYPTYQQINDLIQEIETTNANQLPLMDGYDFANHTRAEFMNTHFGFTLKDNFMLEISSSPNGDSQNELLYDTWSFLIYVAVKHLQSINPVSEIIFTHSENITIDDWYMKESNLANSRNFFENVHVDNSTHLSDIDDTDISLYPIQIDASANVAPVIGTLIKQQATLTELFENLYMYGSKLTELTIAVSDGTITYQDYLTRCALDLCESLSIINISNVEQESHVIVPSLEDVSTYLNSKNIPNKYITITSETYTTIADIVLAYLLNDEEFSNDVTENEDVLLVNCYSLADDTITQKTMTEIREAMIEESRLWEVIQVVNQMYDYSKDKGQNMSQIYAALMSKGVDIKGKAMDIIDLIASSDYSNIHALMSNVFGKITNGYDDQNHVITSPKLSEYTGSACLANVNDKMRSGLEIVANKAASLGNQLISVGKNIANKYYNKIKNTVGDYLGVQNKPFSYNSKGRDDTVDNSWTNFSFSGADILSGWDRFFITMPKIDVNNKIVERELSDFSNESGLSNYRNDFNNAVDLQYLFNLDYGNSSGQIYALLEKLIEHEGEILHLTGPACEIYLSLDTKTNVIATCTFKMMIKWVPIDNADPTSIVSNAINTNAKVSDMILSYFDALISSKPANLIDASTDVEKTWLERSKTTAIMAIIVPRLLEDILQENINANNATALAGGLLLAALSNSVINAHTISNNSNKLAWCYRIASEISNDAYSNRVAVDQARLMSGCNYDSDKQAYVPGTHKPYDENDEICLFDMHRAVSLKYTTLLNPGTWESMDSQYSNEYNTQSILRILLAHVATSVIDEDNFIPYCWCNEIVPGRYSIQTNDQEENELATGVTVLIVTALVVTTGLAVAAKKLITTFKFRGLSRNAENWTWTRTDIGSKINEKQLDINALQQDLRNGVITEDEFNSSVNHIKGELSVLSSRYKQAVKYERKASRKLRRATKWLLSKTATNTVDAIQNTSNMSSLTAGIYSKNEASIANDMNNDDMMLWIKAHI